MQNKSKPTVLQVLPSLVTGGVERGTMDIAKALVDNGFRSLVVSSGGPLVKSIERDGSKHITMTLNTKNPWRIFSNISKLVELIKKEKVDIVHARSRAPAWSAYFAAKKTGCKFITTFHGSYGMQNSIKKLYNSVMVKGEKIIAVSEFISDYICKYYPDVSKKKIAVIHRGVDTKVFDPNNIGFERINILARKFRIPDDKVIIIMPVRFTRWKGHLVLIRALATLSKKQFYCIIVGDVQNNLNYYNEMLELMGEFGLDNNIAFAGAVRDMPALYMISDIVVVPSTRPEAFGRISIETQAMAKIIIATDIGGFKETIIGQENGFIVPPNDSTALAKAIRKAMSLTVKQRQKMGANARHFIKEKFSLDSMIKKTLDQYKKLL
ncbi:MAG: glycosyltransferase family 4 protein [Alphaproteobacteria bacterium]|jgi:glycosyltransferase involved in cell wall biosynthesis